MSLCYDITFSSELTCEKFYQPCSSGTEWSVLQCVAVEGLESAKSHTQISKVRCFVAVCIKFIRQLTFEKFYQLRGCGRRAGVGGRVEC